MMIVLEVKENRAVLLDDNGKMWIVKNRNYSVGQSVAYHKTNTVYKMCAVAACFVMAMFLGTAGYHSYFTVAAYLSVDINPSIQLEINRFEKVIGAVAFNDEGDMILDSVKIKNGHVKTAVEKIIDKAEQAGYLNESDNGVILDISSERTDIVADISAMIEEYADKNINVVVEQSASEDVEMSKSLNVSIGRVKALREYSEIFGGDIKENYEALKESSVKELREKNRQKTDDKSGEDNKGNDDNNNTEQYTGEKDNTDKIKASAKSDKETEKQAETKQKNVEEAEKEAGKQAEETKKEAEKRAEEAEKESEKREEEAEKQAEEAKKEAEKRAEAAEKEAEKREEEAEKEAQKRAKESEKAAEKSDKNK